MSVATTLKEIDGMPRNEQIELAHLLWERLIDSGWHPVVSDATKNELDRRLSEIEANPDKMLTWDQIEAHVSRKR